MAARQAERLACYNQGSPRTAGAARGQGTTEVAAMHGKGSACCARAWAAGLFDGEGWLGTGASVVGTQARLRLQMTVYQTDEAMLRRFAAVVAAGRVCGPYQQRLSRKPIWTWAAGGVEAEAALRVLLPHLDARNLVRAEQACLRVRQRTRELPPHRDVRQRGTARWTRLALRLRIARLRLTR